MQKEVHRPSPSCYHPDHNGTAHTHARALPAARFLAKLCVDTLSAGTQSDANSWHSCSSTTTTHTMLDHATTAYSLEHDPKRSHQTKNRHIKPGYAAMPVRTHDSRTHDSH